MKPDFDKAQNTATELLLRQNINSLYIDVRNFTLPSYITIDSMQNYASITGFPLYCLEQSNIEGALLLKQGSQYVILYDDNIRNESRKHWGVVHELGHLLLGHTDDDRKSEIEAHFFTAQVVTPEIVLWNICKRQGALYDYELPNRFNISCEAATKRIQTLQRRNCYNCSSIDTQLLERFSPILDREIHSRKHVS